MKAALELLQIFTERIPPSGPAKHNLTLTDDGKHLQLNLVYGGKWQAIYFSADEDYILPAEKMFEEIMESLKVAELI